ncbi:hypothetical protein V6Z11_1Z100500 [Gossypium hirsutum]
MGSLFSKQVERRKNIKAEKKTLCDLNENCGETYPGSDYRPADRKNWMAGLGVDKVHINKIVWPGTHDSATNKIGIPFITRPFAQCQSLSVYQQLVKNRRVCHGILTTYGIDVVIGDIKKFLSETQSEVIILEIRTEFGHQDPPEFEKYLEEQLGEYLIHQDEHVFGKTIAELLPKRIICVWKPNKSPHNWIDTDLPSTKFDSNLKHLSEQAPASSRKFFYRVENTVTPQPDNPIVCVKPVTNRIHGYARFIDEDFVDACVGLTQARVEGAC